MVFVVVGLFFFFFFLLLYALVFFFFVIFCSSDFCVSLLFARDVFNQQYSAQEYAVSAIRSFFLLLQLKYLKLKWKKFNFTLHSKLKHTQSLNIQSDRVRQNAEQL